MSERSLPSGRDENQRRRWCSLVALTMTPDQPVELLAPYPSRLPFTGVEYLVLYPSCAVKDVPTTTPCLYRFCTNPYPNQRSCRTTLKMDVPSSMRYSVLWVYLVLGTECIRTGGTLCECGQHVVVDVLTLP